MPEAAGPATDRDVAFLAGGGEMGERLRRFDWASHPMGPPAAWHASLKAMVRMMLTTQHPVFIFWGTPAFGLYNDAYSRVLGPEKHPAILGMPGPEAWAEIWPFIGPQIELVMAGHGATWHENQLVPILRRGRLEEVWWTYSYGPIDDPLAPGGIGGVLVLCTETTEQVKTAQRLALERERFAALFEQAPTFMALLRGPDHVFEMVNPAYQALVGGRSVVGQTVRDVVPEAVGQGYLALLDSVFRTGQAYRASGSRLELQSTEPGGAPVERWLDFVYQPIVDAKGQVDGIFVVGTDATDRHVAEQALRATDRRKDEYLATLAHELRNPLSAVRSAAHLLRQGRLTPEQVQRYAAVVDRHTVAMAALLDDLLDAARITSGRFELDEGRSTLQSIVGAAIESSASLIQSHRHHLAVDLQAPEAIVLGDALRLGQVLANLLTNAAKYTDAGGHISLQARTEGGTLHLAVSDNGIGLKPESLPLLFEMFHQEANSIDRSEGGLGIGLAVTRAIVGLHGGHIEARSAGLGQGSTFAVTLPGVVEVAAEAAAHAPAAGPPRADRSAARVLIADDNVDAAAALGLALELDGHSVQVVHDGEAAEAAVATFHPQACLIDLGMPRVDGLTLARRLRAADGGRAMLLIAVTGWAQEQDRRRTTDAGFDFHIPKPADPQELSRLIERHAKRDGAAD